MILSDCKVFREAVREYCLLSGKQDSVKSHDASIVYSERSLFKAYRAKTEALRIIEGIVAEQYAMLWDNCHELEDKNLGSTTKMHYACHLKGFCGGQLLTEIRINPNNETWVLAYAVVEMETRESWTWFIDLLAKDVDIVNSHE
ncbi:hypothetical protein L3X38_026785 [Prunus dulcis]|uniref:MULE transposase domain-containing protein n=1 Tax=Prunus dulcis TaxID=3755 RepID=A0AAD4VLP5_PRUDU|nr:hypothetical protein L3X38_026785 [Prunus dulcis]